MKKKYDKKITTTLFSIDYFSNSLNYDEREKKLNELFDYVAKLSQEFGYETLLNN